MSATPSASFPVTIADDDSVPVTLDAAPQRIITFAPSATEIVYALGLGDELVGVSGKYDDYPPAAKQVQEVGGAGDFGVDPNIETVVSLEPDLLLTIEGGDAWKARLRELGVALGRAGQRAEASTDLRRTRGACRDGRDRACSRGRWSWTWRLLSGVRAGRRGAQHNASRGPRAARA